MKILLLGSFSDQQTGIYLLDSLKKISSDVAAVDIRKIVMDIGANEKSQETIINEIKDMKINPDVVLVLKGLEIMPKTFTILKSLFPKAIFVNWMFDKFIGETPAWKNKNYLEYAKMYDRFFCSLKGVCEKLIQAGLYTEHLPEAAHQDYNGATYLNYYQQDKYGADISFIGSLGYTSLHPNRIPILKKVAQEGFDLKVWGDVVTDWKMIPREIRRIHAQDFAVNERHSKVAQCSIINLGIDQDPTLAQSQSARMYRVMCAGGLYLTTYCPELEDVFKINKKDEPILDDQELVVYYDIPDLIDKLDYLLEHEELCKKIGKNGREAILEAHTFDIRVKELMEMIKNGKTKRKRN